jgi:hypothetical protein
MARDTLLQRGSKLCVIDGDPKPPRRVLPQSVTMREGLDQKPRISCLVEEEVPRSSAHLGQHVQSGQASARNFPVVVQVRL